MPEAARALDPIAHTSALAGLIGGLVVGAIVGAAIVATGGAAAAAIAVAAAGGASLGASAGQLLGSLFTFKTGTISLPCSTTVIIGKKNAARALADMGDCSGIPFSPTPPHPRMERGRISQVLVDFALSIFGSLRGALAYVCIAATALFAAISGSSVATALAMGRSLIPQMRARGYPDSFTTGTLGAAATLGILIPPSLPMWLLRLPELDWQETVEGICREVADLKWYAEMNDPEGLAFSMRTSLREALQRFGASASDRL